MADAILSILNDPAKGAAMGQRGEARLTQDFGRTGWMQKIRPIIQETV
jgi:hypothetical protein